MRQKQLTQKGGIIIDRVSIDKRPKIVEKKNRIGDFEIDTVIGRHHIGALVTVVDRKSKFTLIKKVASKQAKEVIQALMGMLLPLKPITKTITSDNGKEICFSQRSIASTGYELLLCTSVLFMGKRIKRA